MKAVAIRLFTICLGTIVLVVSSVSAQQGLALMKVEPGARPAGMGGAFVSVAGDANSSAYNPAGAVSLSHWAFSVGHNAYWKNVRLETGYVAGPLSSRTYIHGGIRVAAVDDIEGRSAPTLQPDYTFSSRDISFKGGLSYRFTDKWSAGFGVGWFVEKIDSWRGWTWDLDLGVLYQHSPALTLGGSVANMGPDFSLELAGNEDTDKISLPLTYRVGGSYRYSRYLGALDVVVVDDEARVHAGAEADLHEVLSIRAGYMFNYDSKNLTAGVTLSKRNFALDYAFIPYSNDLGTSHLINLSISL